MISCASDGVRVASRRDKPRDPYTETPDPGPDVLVSTSRDCKSGRHNSVRARNANHDDQHVQYGEK
jgi:hypothetical protein